MKNYQLALNTIINKIGKKTGIHILLRPVILHIVATSKCNLRCIMCNIWKEKSKEDINPKIISKLLKSKIGRTIQIIDITGGEPYLSGFSWISTAPNIGRAELITISTNGSIPLQIKKKTEKILQHYHKKLLINISLDGKRETHDKIRGVNGTYDNIMKTITALKKLRRKYNNLCISLKFTILPINYSEMLDIFWLSRKMDLDFSMKLFSVSKFFNNNEIFSFQKKDIIKVIGNIKKIIKLEEEERAKKLGKEKFGLIDSIYFHSKKLYNQKMIEYLEKKYIKKQIIKTRICYSNFCSILVHKDNKVYSCPKLMRELGDLKKEDVESIWFDSPVMKNFREFSNKGSCNCLSQCDKMPAYVLENFGYLSHNLIKETLCYALIKARLFFQKQQNAS